MDAEKKYRRLFLIIGIPVLIIFIIWKESSDAADQREYFSSLHINLKGVVTYVDAPNGFNAFGVVGLDLIQSNIKEFDQRNERGNYYCLIKNNKAEIYQWECRECAVGDTVLINTDNSLFEFYGANHAKINLPLMLYDNRSFWEYVEKNYQKF